MANNSSLDGFRRFMGYFVFPAAAAMGFYGTMKLSRDNGLTDSMLQNVLQSPSYLPDLTRTPIREWTGVMLIDKYFSFFVTFFWPVITSRDEIVQLQSRHFVGQFVAMWTLLELEGAKSGSSRGFFNGTLSTGLWIQNIAAATTVPLYATIQLLKGRSTSKPAKTDSAAESQRLQALPISITLGLLAPLGLMIIAKSPEVKQLAIVIFQIFPIFTSAFIRLLAPLLPSESPVTRKAGGSLPRSLTVVYVFSATIAAISHVVTLWEAVSRGVSLGDVFIPRLTLSNPSNMVEAGLNFLRWDEAVSCGSMLLWSLTRYVLDTAPARGFDYISILQATSGAVVGTILLGPAGAAAGLLRQRDVARA